MSSMDWYSDADRQFEDAVDQADDPVLRTILHGIRAYAIAQDGRLSHDAWDTVLDSLDRLDGGRGEAAARGVRYLLRSVEPPPTA